MAKMRQSFDISKFKKETTKNIEGISIGFRDPSEWIHTGNYALNYRISGDFQRGIPLGKVTIIAGQPGSGKSYIASANVVRNAQKQGVYVVIIDSENALDQEWLEKLGVNTTEDKLLKVNLAMINDVGRFISDFVKGYRKDYGSAPEKERPKILFVIDSLSMLLTPTDVDQFERGDMKGDMGRRAKALKALILNCVNMFADLDIGLLATNHVIVSQDQYAPDDVIVGGSGPIFAASIVLTMKKGKLKEDADGVKTTDVNGIRSICTVAKSRFNHKSLFKKIEIKIPFETGMDEYSGLFDMFESMNVLKKEGNRYKYLSPVDGTEIKEFRKNFTHEQFDKIMSEFDKLVINESEEPVAGEESADE